MKTHPSTIDQPMASAAVAVTPRRKQSPWLAAASLVWCVGLGLGLCISAQAATPAATPAELLAGYVSQAGAPADAARGQRFFTERHGRDWSCSSCHGGTPTQQGKHASTGKAIGPLAPAFNPERFTDAAKAEKWFRRNCQDVVGRECSAAEKADVLAWLMTLKP